MMFMEVSSGIEVDDILESFTATSATNSQRSQRVYEDLLLFQPFWKSFAEVLLLGSLRLLCARLAAPGSLR